MITHYVAKFLYVLGYFLLGSIPIGFFYIVAYFGEAKAFLLTLFFTLLSGLCGALFWAINNKTI